MNKLTVLGCGDAFASGGRYSTSFLIEDGDNFFLLDCGASTLTRLKMLYFQLDQLKTILITHFHGDHYGGIPFLLISNKFEWGGKLPWTIIGPAGIKNQLRILQEAMYPGTGILLDELDLKFVEFNQEDLHIDNLIITAFPVKHSPLSNPHGLRIESRSKVIAFTGDTEWDENLIKLGSHADVYIMECFKDQILAPGHLSLKIIEEKAHLINCKRLLLTHMGSEVLNLINSPFERLFDGQVIEL